MGMDLTAYVPAENDPGLSEWHADKKIRFERDDGFFKPTFYLDTQAFPPALRLPDGYTQALADSDTYGDKWACVRAGQMANLPRMDNVRWPENDAALAKIAELPPEWPVVLNWTW